MLDLRTDYIRWNSVRNSSESLDNACTNFALQGMAYLKPADNKELRLPHRQP